jgi:putative acyl-CoA dehydrogenase
VARHGSAELANAYCATRLAGNGGHLHGTLPAGTAIEGLLAAAAPG